MPSTHSTVSSPSHTIRDRRQRHRASAGVIGFRRRADESGASFIDEFPTSELAPQQPQVQTAFAPDDDHTDPWPVRAATAGVSAQERPDDAQVDTPRPATTPDIAAGRVLGGRYVLDRIIGQGGNARVFLARDLQRPSEGRSAKNFVALKLLQPAHPSYPHALVRLKREFRQTQSLLHPGIVQVFDLDCEGDVWFLTMELVAGETASTWMRKGVSHADAMKVIRGCCMALDHAHSKGILHGDLKPSNVLVLKDAAIKLIDFGSAGTASDRADVGVTPCYASREVLLGEGIEQRDDVFSLACLCYAILSGGGHPFDRKTALEAAQAHMAPIPILSIPERLFQVIALGLSMDRASRPASVRAFLHELRRATKPMTPAMATQMAPDAVLEATRRASAASRPTFWPQLNAAIRFDALTARRYRHGLVGLSVAALGVVVPVRLSVEQAVVRQPANPVEVPMIAATAVGSASAPVKDVSLPRVEPKSDSEITAQVPAIADSPGIVTFDQATVVAGTSQPLVAITLRRLQSTRGSAEVQWRLESGSAQPDVDYERIRPQIVRFFEGQSVRTVFVSVIPAGGSAAPHGSRTFTVALQKLPGGPALGPVARVAVTISAPGVMNESGAVRERVAGE